MINKLVMNHYCFQSGLCVIVYTYDKGNHVHSHFIKIRGIPYAVGGF